MEAPSPDLKTTYRRLRWIAPFGLLLSILLGFIAVGFDYLLRIAGLWSTYGGGSESWWHYRCVGLVDIAEFGAVIFLYLTTAVAIEALGRWPRWLAIGWISAPLAAGLVSIVLGSNFPRWFGVWDAYLTPVEPAAWLVHQITRAALEWSLWLTLAAGLVFLHWLALASLWTVRRIRGADRGETPSERSSVTSRALLLTAVALTAMTGAALGAMGIAITGLSHAEVTIAVGLCTGLLTAALAAGSITLPSTVGKATVSCIFGAIAAALLNTPLSFIVVSKVGAEFANINDRLFSIAPLSAVFGATIAAPLGFTFGLLYLVPVRVAHRLCRSLAHEALDKVLLVVGTWSLCVGALCLVGGLFLVRQNAFYPPNSIIPNVIAVIVMVIGAIASIVGFVRLKVRRRWLERVRKGRVDGWELVPLSEPEELVVGLRPMLDARGTADAVLARKLPGHPSGAYRTGDTLVPEALVVTAALR